MQGLTGIVEIEESYDKIIALAGGIPRRPVIIVVYGMPHHGKTFFIQEFINCRAQGSLVIGTHDPEKDESYEKSDFYLIETQIGCPGDTCSVEAMKRQVRRALNKDVDLHVLVNNPNLYTPDLDKCRRVYNLTILNRASKEKLIQWA